MKSSSRPLGYDVDDNAIRFSNYFHVLRELVHLSNGWMPLEPSWPRKYALADHVHDDARALTKIKRRLYELRHPSDYPGAPSTGLCELLDRLSAADSPGAYEDLAYGEAKPALVRAMRTHLANLDPVADEPSLRLLTQVVERQERHIRELGGEPRGDGDIGELPVRLRAEPRALRVLPPLSQPGRDEFVEVTEHGDPYLSRELYVNGAENHVPTEPDEQRHFFHGLMDAELSAAELMARNSHEYPEMPWDFHVDMARQSWDEVRHAKVHDLLMKDELGCAWGDYPVGFSYFKSIYAYDLLGRLCLFNGTSEQRAMWRHSHRRKTLMELGQERVALVFDYLLADEVPHVHNGVRWGSHLLGGSERAYRDKVRELRAGLDETGAPAPAPA
ncbi:MAG TPA: DUF455 family protein [Thermoleophilaceae bacterium]|jgi:hypothetical protein